MFGRLALLVGSVLLTLFGLEIGCRLVRGPSALVHWPNMVLAQRREWARHNIGDRFIYDPELGFRQRPGFASKLIHHDSEGFRVMPPLTEADAKDAPILATGDSYTQGDEVGDQDSWPAQLQPMLRRRIINAGVPAYGIDQTILRTQQLVPQLKPSLVIVGFIEDDVRRAEMSRSWGAEKSYFTVDGDTLTLRHVPVPPSPKADDTLDFWQRAFGWSVLVDTVLVRAGRAGEWAVDHVRATPPGTGERIACLLMPRLKALRVPTLVVAQYDFTAWVDEASGRKERTVSRAVLKCAEDAGLATLDLYDRQEKAVHERGRDGFYLLFHPNPYGYGVIARGIADELERRHMVPR